MHEPEGRQLRCAVGYAELRELQLHGPHAPPVLFGEVLPELARHLGLGGRRTQPHQTFLEPLGLQSALERLLEDEHDAMAAPAQNIADADAVVGWPEGALREEDDGLSHRVWLCARRRL